ncbi:MarR family transcriptional regulator [Paenibacillus doosanensis]|uniref:Transcriptional repressor MprA n=1 Tax=Paenibacillus konkukensis TaxID=2020716 RepID=A0ABY4RLV9_9BACL|nr:MULTISPECIES: MarR family transcriptional regulator [Paenibacillus]MCS7462607.1 MarR family transcriptional regulator [Paenibacillus doosanensis]UQZ82573.1 transcriptional repressor MprA [Paenibacillus konkukensis]
MSREQDSTLLLRRLLAMSRQLKRAIQQINKNPYLNHSTISVIFQLEQQSMKMNDIADYLCITLGAATSLVDKLERQQFVERIRSQEDRRIIYVQMTQAGKEKMCNLRKQIFNEAEVIFHQASEEDIRQYIEFADKMESLLSAYNDNAEKNN